MPYVLRQEQTGEIAACIQKNNYNIDYYGVKQWDDEEEAEAQRDTFLNDLGHEHLGGWLVVKLDEHRVKVCNVKLKNDPTRVLTMTPDGALNVHTRQG
ncbi:hypothetical protein [Paenibacillus sp. YYML68]|uniref:hypothetical protein n=1 Tax=Paenibacillus sp. YYML68 TaxID=2909250 RepID=UPI00248FD89D|nr:hypothetical protein [Paenibacillus sp. YYML68]